MNESGDSAQMTIDDAAERFTSGTLSRQGFITRAVAAGASLSMIGGLLAEAAKAGGSRAEAGSLTVGFSIWDLTIPFAVPMAAALKSEAAKKNINLKLQAANFDASIQAQHLAQYVAQKVDVICATPVDVRAILPAATSARKQGVPVIGVGGTIQGFPYIGANDIEYGQHMGQLMLKALKSRNITGEKRVAFLRGLPGGSPDRDRRIGILAVLSKHPDVKVVAEIATNWSQEKGLAATQNILQRFGKGKIHLLHGWGGGVEVPGAKWAYTHAGRKDVIFTGGELTKSTKTAISSGWEYGVIIQDPTTLGTIVMDSVPKMAPKFDHVPASAKIPLPTCTKPNLSKYRAF